MTPERLAKVGVNLYGDHGWQTRMADELGVDGSTVRRWVSGAVPIPNPVEVALNCLLKQRAKSK